MIKFIEKANLALLFVFLIACSSISNLPDNRKEFEGIHPELIPYVNDFIRLVDPHYDKNRLSSLSIGKREINDGNIVGLCKFLGTNSYVEIVIDSPFWRRADSFEKEVLMLHELGHCLCNIYHSHLEGNYDKNFNPFSTDNPAELLKNGYLEDKCPTSIMHPSVLLSACYRKHRDFYRQNLRVQCYYTMYHRNSIFKAEDSN